MNGRIQKLTLAIAGCIAFSGIAAAQEAEADPEGEPIRARLRSYVEAFNANDAAAVAAHWEENAIYVDRETGERLEGRAALQGDFDRLFAENPGIRLSGRTDEVHFVTPDVAMASGTASVFAADEHPAEALFTATLVRKGGEWLLHTVDETDVPAPETSHDALQPLAWLIGDWVDESETMRVDTSVNWSSNGAFLIRSFLVQDADGPVQEGTQVIGWDPRSREIRSWSFNSDGSFGDGVWTQSEDRWLVRSTQTLADGSAASGTYVVTPDGEDSMHLQLIGHEIEGEPQPASDVVTIVRAEAADQPATEETGGAE